MSQILYFASVAKAVGAFGSSNWSYPQVHSLMALYF
jgi:hypothetical protein